MFLIIRPYLIIQQELNDKMSLPPFIRLVDKWYNKRNKHITMHPTKHLPSLQRLHSGDNNNVHNRVFYVKNARELVHVVYRTDFPSM